MSTQVNVVVGRERSPEGQHGVRHEPRGKGGGRHDDGRHHGGPMRHGRKHERDGSGGYEQRNGAWFSGRGGSSRDDRSVRDARKHAERSGQVEGEEAADALQNTFRSNHLECTTGISGGAPAGTLQARVQVELVEGRTALPGAGAMRCELSTGAVEALRVTTALDFVGGSASAQTRTEYTAGREEKKTTKLHGVKDEMHDDFPKARGESEYLAYWVTTALAEKSKKVDGAPLPPDGVGHEGVLEEVEKVWEPLLPAGMDHTDILENMHKYFTKDADFSRIDVLQGRLQDFMLLDDGLFGQRLSSDAREVAGFLNEKSSGSSSGLNGREVTVKRLVECAKRKGWLGACAEFLARNAKKIELVDRAESASATITDVYTAFDENMKKSDGQPLWSLSAKADRNVATFNINMSPAMKERFPRSKYAVRVLEAANGKGWLRSLAKYAADQKKLGEDEVYDEDDDMPNMS